MLPKLGFAKRLLLLYGLIFLAVITFTDWSLSRAIVERENQHLQNTLTLQSRLIAELVGPLQANSELQEKIVRLSKDTGSRITVVAANGKVLADSDESYEAIAKMDSHLTRPEIATALRNKTGMSARYSMTLKTKMLYVAVPIFSDGVTVGAVRSAMPITRVDELLATSRRPVFWITLLGILFITVTGLLFAGHLSKRIRRITSVAERYAAEDWSEQITMDGRDELKMLADTMNHMASVLRNRIRDLENEKRKISAILGNMSDAVIAINSQKEVMLANRTAASFFGFSLDTVRGKSLIECTRHPYLESLVDQAFFEKQTRAGEIQLMQDKKVFHVTVVIASENMRDVAGILVFHDISEIRKLENVRKEFVANASHELRTPLTSLKGFIETLLGGASKDSIKLEKFLKIMQEDATRLGRLVEGMLALGEIEQKLPVKKEAVELVSELRLLVDRFKLQIETRKLSIEDHLPQGPVLISGDRDKIRQVFLNLIDNAIKFNRDGGKILLRAESRKDGTYVFVEDTGIGIPAESLERIFERFYRVENAKAGTRGSGLGLSIVKHIMETHGGRVTCESKAGHGAVFTVYFPR